MNIYFVNKQASIKGPYDIIDAASNKLMRIGDYCIRETNEGVYVLLIVSKKNEWKHCMQLGFKKGGLDKHGNCLLYSFDGLLKRQGNLMLLSRLCELFQENPLNAFFKNAIAILSYECDYWDASIFSAMISHLSHLFKENDVLENEVKHDENNITIFESYLDEVCQNLFRQRYQEGIPLKNIYSEIREKYSGAFRTALKLFLEDYPGSSIYEKSAI